LKEMTSRDIQITIGRSREHTSRLMKRLFEEGLVERNTKMKPFTYKITEKGRGKLGSSEQTITA
ncbi:MAG: MarR family transcriptional regulator, partial [Candidatus Nitrosotenuis sp.]